MSDVRPISSWKTTLQDLLRSEGEMNSWVKTIPTHNPLTFLQ
jgi:hypothetical protein